MVELHQGAPPISGQRDEFLSWSDLFGYGLRPIGQLLGETIEGIVRCAHDSLSRSIVGPSGPARPLPPARGRTATAEENGVWGQPGGCEAYGLAQRVSLGSDKRTAWGG